MRVECGKGDDEKGKGGLETTQVGWSGWDELSPNINVNVLDIG